MLAWFRERAGIVNLAVVHGDITALPNASSAIGSVLVANVLHLIGVMHRRSDDERIAFFVTAPGWTGTIANREPHKCDDRAWFPLDAFPTNLIPHVRRAIELSRGGRWFGSYG